MIEVYKQVFAEFKEGTINSFYEKMYPELIIYASRLLGNEYAFLSEDCVQDAIFQAYKQRHSFSSPFQLKAFIYTCVRNKGISILRKGKAQSKYMAQIEDSEKDLSVNFIEQETLTLLYEAIDSLPEKYKTLFDLSFEQGLKNAEVAKRLNISEIAVKKQKSRFKSLLYNQLKNKIDKEYLYFILLMLYDI